MKARHTLIRWLPALALLACSVHALAQPDPPTRVGSLSAIEGSVVLAPAGDIEWSEAALNRPIVPGDRLWTDPGARADVHLGTSMLHVDSETFLEVRLLDEALLQTVLRKGVVQARVRTLASGELFEIDTPQLAFRALQPGTYRIDADAARRITRVTVRDGVASVSGSRGRTLMLYPGQQLEVAGTDLEQVASVSFGDDAFDRWASDRHARDDQSVAARFVPDLVGSLQLDSHGSWVQDPSYGMVWYPTAVARDWAPYRFGRWQWIKPWGWTWIDNAPWGFAPFHYGRWAFIGSRWAWVPGRLGTRPAYASALVAFVGGGATGALPLGSGAAIAWYPLAPGEAWRPFFAASPTYLRRINQSAGSTEASADGHLRRARIDAVTALRIEEFRSGEPVQRHWVRPHPADLARAQPLLPGTAGAPGGMPAPQAAAAVSAGQRPPALDAPSPWPRVRAVDDAPRRQPSNANPNDHTATRSRHQPPIRHRQPVTPAAAAGPRPPVPAAQQQHHASSHASAQQKGSWRSPRPSSDQDDGAWRRHR
jgi:hypothetical protein